MTTLVAQGASIVIQLVSTVTLARLLSPADYGVMAMVAAVTAFAGLFRDFGLSAAAVQKQALTHAQQSNLFWINTALGSTLSLALVSVSPLVAWFYKRPEVLWVTVAVSANFVIASLGTQSGVLLLREMRFGRQAAAGLGGALVSLSLSIVLALQGLRYWSLVWGQLAGVLTTTLLLLALSSFRPGLPRRGAGLKEMIRFGAHITAFDVANYFHRNLDNVLIGRFWGAAALGLYSRAYSLLMLPIANVRDPINRVAFPALSRLQTEPDAYRRYYCRVTSLVALLSMPVTAFLFVASRQVVELLLGRQWLGVSAIFSWLALATFIQPASGLGGSLLLSLGQGRRYLQCGLFNTVILSASFVLGLPWGPVGVALAYAVANYVILYPWLRWAFLKSPVSFGDFVRASWFPATVSLAAAALVVLLKPQLAALPIVAQLGAFCVTFVLVFVAAACFTRSGREYASLVLEVARQFRFLGERR